MGSGIQYQTKAPVDDEKLTEIRSIVEEENAKYQWWCESMWVSDEHGDDGSCFGATKLFRMIDDPIIDTYMSSLDMRHLLNVLDKIAKQTKTEWVISVEGAYFGETVDCSLPAEVIDQSQEMLSVFGVSINDMPSRNEVLLIYGE